MKITNISHDQQLAIDMGLDLANRIVGVTGEAGTGKTFVLGEIGAGLKERKYEVALTAPTGRAAARIQESSGIRAVTIHRLLRWTMPDEDDDDFGMPSHSKMNPMPYDVILVDESSMMSEDLYRALIDAMKPGACIRFFGDMNQLPPVEGESPFLKLLKRFPSIKLEENFRSDSGIVKAARQVIKGVVPSPNPEFQLLNIGHGFTLSVLDKFLDADFTTMDAQVIIPTKVGKYGTIAVNKYMQQKLNTHPRSILLSYNDGEGEIRHTRLRPGDKILWTKNIYDLKLFNGMIGYVVDFDDETGTIVANFEGRDRVIPPHMETLDSRGKSLFAFDPRKYIDLAYAITTHKSQGSEFKKIVVLLQRSRVLNKANFYTAITRAKLHVTCIAGAGGLSAAMMPYKSEKDR